MKKICRKKHHELVGGLWMNRIKDVDILLEKAILVGVNLRNDEHFDYSVEELKKI